MGYRGDPRNCPHHKGADQASKKDDLKKKAAPAFGAASDAKHSGNSTAPLDKRAVTRAADTAAAAQKVSAKAEYMAQPKSGNSSVAPSVTKPSSSSPSKGKSGRGSKHQHKPSFTSPYLHLPLRLGALAVLENSHDSCLNSHRGSLREPWVVLASRKTLTGGSAKQKRRMRKKGDPRRFVPIARRGKRAVHERTTHGRGAVLL